MYVSKRWLISNLLMIFIVESEFETRHIFKNSVFDIWFRFKQFKYDGKCHLFSHLYIWKVDDTSYDERDMLEVWVEKRIQSTENMSK